MTFRIPHAPPASSSYAEPVSVLDSTELSTSPPPEIHAMIKAARTRCMAGKPWDPTDAISLLTTKEAAVELGRSEQTLRNQRSAGGGPNHVRDGRSIFYLKSDLDRWSKEQCRYVAPSLSRADIEPPCGA